MNLIDGISGQFSVVKGQEENGENPKSSETCNLIPANCIITGITQDSRKVKPGYLFAALKGAVSDGTDFIPMAIKNGAVAILLEGNSASGVGHKEEYNARQIVKGEKNQAADPLFLYHSNPKLALAQIAANFYKTQPEVIVAITGTNGKTSTAYFCTQIWQLLGKKSASIGTIGIATGGVLAYEATGSMTTPDPIKLHEILANLSDDGITHLAMEASSHGLDQYRLGGVRVNAAAFTNITRDHLDYHGTFAKYLDAKLRLFEIMQNGVAVINADISESAQIIKLCEERGHRVLSVGKNGGYIVLNDIIRTREGQQVSFEVAGKLYNTNTHLIGEFQAYNLLTALALVVACGANIDEVIEVLAQVQAVPGRMQGVYKGKEGRAKGEVSLSSVYVDYAHTPDALEKALRVLRPYAIGKLWVVFGCGGDRDKGKRPQMGAAAAKFADIVVVTDDNPRTENPAIIRKEILAECSNAKEIADRHEAIKYAIANMGGDDILLIAGKGHEKVQIIGDVKLDFDDVAVAQMELDSKE